ncbi:hypothetical protein R1flu_028810 [Riccia fluitans]|uniref:F-box domain-containing protein n=1 Tax=Riccia fluitans TaxID=41844 RepID=A0ABD1XMQ1_9MARC
MWSISRCFGTRACFSPINRAEDEEDPVQLPPELVEKIIAAVPYPHVLKARQLSREWRSKFSRVVNQVSDSWPEVFPAYYCKRRSRVEGYDVTHRCVKRLGRKKIKTGGLDALVTCFGTLLVAVDLIPGSTLPIAVLLNLLTRRGSIVFCPNTPVPLDGDCVVYLSPMLVPDGADHYELVVWFSVLGIRDDFCKVTVINVYSSRTDSWKEVGFEDELGGSQSGAYMDGSLYCIPDVLSKVQPVIVRFDTQSGIRSVITQVLHEDGVFGEWVHHAVVRCGSSILAVMFEINRRNESFHVKVMRLNTESFQLVELSRILLPYVDDMVDVNVNVFEYTVASSSKCIYILDEMTPHLVIKYDVNANKWYNLGPVPEKFTKQRNLFAFEPGLNPFLEP